MSGETATESVNAEAPNATAFMSGVQRLFPSISCDSGAPTATAHDMDSEKKPRHDGRG